MIRFDAPPNAPRLAPLQMGAPDILAWLLAKEPTAIGAWNELGSAQYVRAWTAAQTAGYDIVNDLYFAMVDTVERGGSEADFAKMVTPILKQKGWLGGDDGKIATRVALIYDTNLRMAREAGRWNRYQTTKAVFPYIRAIDVGDSRVRHPPKSPHSDHRAWGGIVLPADHPFWLTYWPPLGFRCFLPQTRIEGAVMAGIRRWHDGPAVEISLRSGRKLAVTSDHAILTGRGWLLAKHIRKGDHCASRRRVINGSTMDAVNDRDAPARADDLFQAIRSNALAGVEGLSLQFDDQTGAGQGKIDVAFANSGLADKMRAKLIGQHPFVGAASRPVHHPIGGLSAVQDGIGEAYPRHSGQASDFAFADAERFADSAHGSIRGGGQFTETGLCFGVPIARHLPRHPALPLSASRRFLNGLPLDDFRLGSSAQDDALFGELARDGSAADAGLFGKIVDTDTFGIERDEVVDIREFNFCGHVYDFQTEEGVVLADEVVAHNCRCATVQMSRSQFARFKGGVTSPEELADRIARLGPPIFLAPGASVAAKVDEAIKGANERRIPGEAPIDREKVIRGGVAQWERAQAGIRDQQLEDAIAEITVPAAPVEAREYVSPINRAPIAVEKRASINKRLTSEFSEAAQDSRYSAIEFRDRKQDQVGKSGLSSKFTDESASLIARLKAEVDDLADQLRLPRLRGFKTGTGKAIGDQGDGIMSLNPQWFNGFASSVGGGGNVALAKITAEREQIGARLAALRDRHDVVKEELRKLGMSGDEQWLRLYDEQSAILKEHEKLRKRDAVLWKEANVAKRSGDARAASTWKPGDDPEKRPFNAEAYFEDGLDKARLVMFHEFAHHIHQYISRIGTYRQVRKQPLEVELLAIYREAMADAKGRQLSTYSTKNEFEYFAENFGAFAMGRTDLVDPRALKLIERLFREKR